MNEEKRICWDCGAIIENEGDAIWYEEEQAYICQDCYDNSYYTCEECGEVIHCDKSTYINDTIYCQTCVNNKFTACRHCGKYVANDETYETENGDVCETCRYDHFEECVECGSVYYRDNMHYDDYDDCYYCDDCVKERTIKEYSYKPTPLFLGNGSLYMGIELEIDGAGTNEENARKIQEEENNIYIKRDGSLDEGLELVSHPATLEYHENKMRWYELMETALNLGYTSHDAGTCGLHIHVSRGFFGTDEEEQEQGIQKVLYFMEIFWSKMLIFSRRTQEQLEQWANSYGLKNGETPEELYEKAKNERVRYRAINILNRNTIEFRLYRGTLKYNTFIATLQMTALICQLCKGATDEFIINLEWDYIPELAKANGYNELVEYLKNKNLNGGI